MNKTKSNLMKLLIPSKLEHLNLRGLIAIGKLLDGDDYMGAVADICNISRSQAAMLTNSTLNKIRKALEPALPVIINEYIEAYMSLDFKTQFQCKEYESWEIDVHKADKPRGYYKRRGWNKKLKQMQKPATFVVMSELANEPAHLWVHLQDNLIKQIAAIKEDEPWKAWRFFPDILACCAWKPGEDRFSKNLNNDVIVDWDRIERMKRVFMELDAETAVKVVTFFLTISEVYSKDPNSKFSVKKLATLSLSPLKRVKNSLKDGDTSDILKTFFRMAMKSPSRKS